LQASGPSAHQQQIDAAPAKSALNIQRLYR